MPRKKPHPRNKPRTIGEELADRLYSTLGHFPKLEAARGAVSLGFWFKTGDVLELSVGVKMLERFPIQTASYIVAAYMHERNAKRGQAVDWRDVERKAEAAAGGDGD